MSQRGFPDSSGANNNLSHNNSKLHNNLSHSNNAWFKANVSRTKPYTHQPEGFLSWRGKQGNGCSTKTNYLPSSRRTRYIRGQYLPVTSESLVPDCLNQQPKINVNKTRHAPVTQTSSLPISSSLSFSKSYVNAMPLKTSVPHGRSFCG